MAGANRRGSYNRGSAADLALVTESRPAVVVVPKVESTDHLTGLPVPAEAQIETARGLVECERIAAAPGVEALVLGPGDLAASLGVPELSIGEGAHIPYALMRILVAARAFGCAAIDGPFARFDDAGRIANLCNAFTRSWLRRQVCIHPSQIATCNEVFTPTEEELERARRIMAVEGVSRVDGEMLDEANRRMAEAVPLERETIGRLTHNSARR